MVTFTPWEQFLIVLYLLGPIFFIILILLYAMFTSGLRGVFVRLGIRGWLAYIPFANTIILFKTAWGKAVFYFFSLIPIANIVFFVITYRRIAKRFDKGAWFTVGLLLLGFVFWPVLGKKEENDEKTETYKHD